MLSFLQASASPRSPTAAKPGGSGAFARIELGVAQGANLLDHVTLHPVDRTSHLVRNRPSTRGTPLWGASSLSQRPDWTAVQIGPS